MTNYEEEAQEEQYQENLEREQPAGQEENPYMDNDVQLRQEMLARQTPSKIRDYFEIKDVLLANLNAQDRNVVIMMQYQIKFLHNLGGPWVDIADDYASELKVYLASTNGMNMAYVKALLTKAKEVTRRAGEAFKPQS